MCVTSARLTTSRRQSARQKKHQQGKATNRRKMLQVRSARVTEQQLLVQKSNQDYPTVLLPPNRWNLHVIWSSIPLNDSSSQAFLHPMGLGDQKGDLYHGVCFSTSNYMETSGHAAKIISKIKTGHNLQRDALGQPSFSYNTSCTTNTNQMNTKKTVHVSVRDRTKT